MKKNYETPIAEKIEFAYQDQVVAASFGEHECTVGYKYNYGEPSTCTAESYWKSPSDNPWA